MRAKVDTDNRIAAMATRQHGVISRRQLLALGLSSSGIDRRVGAGRLHPLHRGVYCVGHRVLGRFGRWRAAVLACGEHGVLSHGSAAAAWRIRSEAAGVVDVTVTNASGRPARRGLRIHRVRLGRDDVTLLQGIPITTPSRTLVDLAAMLPPRQLERALDEAQILGLLDHADLTACAARATRGRRALTVTLARHRPGSTATRSGLEEAFLALCRATPMPQPLVNARVGRMTVDFLWATERVVVETDGAKYHRTATQRERDRRRDALLGRWGYRVLRVTDTELERRPDAVLDKVRAAVAAKGTRQVALLRGINVGRNKQLPMADLRELLEGLGYDDVATHLRSGNAVYTAARPPQTAAAEIERAIVARFGFEVAVVSRTAAEIDRVVALDPLREVADDDAKYLVVFLSAKPTAADRKRIDAIDIGREQLRFDGREAYIWAPNGINESRAWKAFSGSRPGVVATARNFNTVRKLAAMLAG